LINIIDNERDWKSAIRIIDRTVAVIATALSKMTGDLPASVASQMAIELVIRRLARSEEIEWQMQLIMEDHNVREAYYSEIAKRPATAKPI
jgi:hypothetical protein